MKKNHLIVPPVLLKALGCQQLGVWCLPQANICVFAYLKHK